jgi:two-component system sensor histidine kinase RegB
MSEPILSTGNALNLKRLIWMRLIILTAEAIAAWVAVSQWHLTLPLPALMSIWVVMGTISIGSFIRLQFDWPVADTELFIQLLLEALALTAVLYFSGGSTNPFAPFYLLPLTLTAASLSGIYTWAMMLFSLACYTLLLFYNVPLPAVHGGHGTDFRLHELGMWFGFLLSAVLIAAFAVRMASTVRQRERMIADMREQQLRHERVLALGTLAAGAAHELGTPLATMAVLLKDLEPEQAISGKKLGILRGQVERCKNILGSISAAAGELRAESGSAQALDTYLRDLLQRWAVSRNGIQLQQHLEGCKPAPRVVIDQTLEQALINILNNAADASPLDITVEARWTEHELCIDVADRGAGIASELQSLAGKTILSTKQDGLGLGLFLSYTTLQRLGGDVQLVNREGGGVICRIRLLIDKLRVPENEQ